MGSFIKRLALSPVVGGKKSVITELFAVVEGVGGRWWMGFLKTVFVQVIWKDRIGLCHNDHGVSTYLASHYFPVVLTWAHTDFMVNRRVLEDLWHPRHSLKI